ncbi:MAG: hypothetical protein M3P30_16520 [Chloroflexota bacterium]|nr:hypothetical protein [Chloroflexota bacterium]
MSDLSTDADLTAGFDAFASQLAAQLACGVTPSHEHDIHFCLALGLQAEYALPLGSIIFEHNRTDLWLVPRKASFEVKYSRKLNAGPGTLATILQDMRKLARSTDSDERFFVLVSGTFMDYLRRHQPTLMPLTEGATTTITATRLGRLTKGVRDKAMPGWTDVNMRLLWTRRVEPWRIDVWRVTLAAATADQPPQTPITVTGDHP